MECADGGNLGKMIRERNRRYNNFSEKEILDYFTQICLALKHCHDRNILHRDLKPDHIFMTRSGLCKLGDFSVSKILDNKNKET